MFRAADDRERFPAVWLALVLLVALTLRVGLGIWLPADQSFIEELPDQAEYREIADSVLAGNGFVVVDERYPTPQTLLAQRMPGYPLFLAACGGSVRVARVAQGLIDTSTVLATFLLARRWLNARASLVAALFVALSPFLAYFSNLLLSETLYTALLAWGMLGLARPGTRGKLWWLGMAALVAAVYIRPSGAGLAVVMGIASVFLPGRHPFAVHSRWPLPVGLTTLLMVLAALAPWAVRNRLVLGEWVWTTTNNGITLYDGWQIDNTTGGSDQSFVSRMSQLGLMNEVERDSYLRGKAVQAVREWPGRAVLLALKKAGRTWSPVPLSQGGQRAYLLAGLIYSVPLFALALAGVLFSDLRTSVKAFLLAPAVYLTFLHMLSVGSIRYRLPADPALAILAAAGIVALTSGFVSWWQQRVAADDESSDARRRGRGFEVIQPEND